MVVAMGTANVQDNRTGYFQVGLWLQGLGRVVGVGELVGARLIILIPSQ